MYHKTPNHVFKGKPIWGFYFTPSLLHQYNNVILAYNFYCSNNFLLSLDTAPRQDLSKATILIVPLSSFFQEYPHQQKDNLRMEHIPQINAGILHTPQYIFSAIPFCFS